jgi:uncharacterized protein with HEPN domain
MSKKSKEVLLRHMLDHAQEAVGFIQGKRREDLNTDRMRTLALTRLLEVIGEAAARMPAEVAAAHPQIPWAQIVALRNRLIHGYDNVDLDILWKILTDDLPPLIAALQAILASESAP